MDAKRELPWPGFDSVLDAISGLSLLLLFSTQIVFFPGTLFHLRRKQNHFDLI